MAGTQRAGVIGLGNIGGGVARSIVRSGRPTTVFDVAEPMLQPFRGKAGIATSAADLAEKSDVILIAVLSADQVEQVIFGENGIASAPGGAGKVIGVQSTISLHRLLDFRERGMAKGLAVIDSCVTGGSIGAEAGKLVSLVGASDEDYARALPVLEDFNSLVLHMGPPGAGIRAKVTRNIMAYFQLAGAYEASRLAAAAGVDVERLADAIRVSEGQTGGIAASLLNMSKGVYHGDTPEAKKRSQGTTALSHKDLSAAIELADELGVDLVVTKIIESRSEIHFGAQAAETAR